jgi:hypothetical protein
MALSAPKVSSTVPVGVPLLAAPEEFSYQLFSLLGVSGCEKPPTTRLNLYWNLKYIDVRSFILSASNKGKRGKRAGAKQPSPREAQGRRPASLGYCCPGSHPGERILDRLCEPGEGWD